MSGKKRIVRCEGMGVLGCRFCNHHRKHKKNRNCGPSKELCGKCMPVKHRGAKP